MPAENLRIDTAGSAVPGPSSGKTSAHEGGATPVSSQFRSAPSSRSVRSDSSASAGSFASSPAVQLPQPHASSAAGTGAAGSSSYSASASITGIGERDSSEYVLAMHDFAPQHQNVTCLAFSAGQVIHVLNRDPSGWWDGELEGRRGWFPSNYVTSDVGLLTEEELPQVAHARNGNGHTHSNSNASTTSWTGLSSTKGGSFSRTDHRPMPSETPGMDSYCPPLMVPLLHGLSLLQNAVRSNRIAHFQPATACIISCVRAVLSEVGCLPRDAPILKQYVVLAKERKRILSDLASLVSQAKKASEDSLDEEQRELEVEGMVRLGGQLFAHVRGFLAVAVQCGVNVQPTGRPEGPDGGSTDTEGRWGSHEGTLVKSDRSSPPLQLDYGQYWESVGAGTTTNGIHHRRRRREAVTTPSMRAKSMVDLRSRRRLEEDPETPPLPKIHTNGVGPAISKIEWTPSHSRRFVSIGHRAGQLSVSSASSSSSFSSGESACTPCTPPFPVGPTTSAEVMDALRHAHDHYLSTIAAFIGHAHSHSRSSHASSTGHMYDLVREVVEMVCKLLTIVEAVLRHPDIPLQRATELRAAKEGLYNVTSTLADAVRLLTTSPLLDVTEEEEKAVLLRSATNALKAGSDCVNAVKRCLQRSTGELSFIIELPRAGEVDPSSFTPSKFSHRLPSRSGRLREASSMNALRELYSTNGIEGDDEDLTIQAQTASFGDTRLRLDIDGVTAIERPGLSPTSPITSPITSPLTSPFTSPFGDDTDVEDAPLSAEPLNTPPDKPLPFAHKRNPSAVSTAVSFTPSDDRTTWEGSHRSRHGHGPYPDFEEKLLNGHLPAVPEDNISEMSELARPDPTSWMLDHDHSSDDVAYNSEGQLVGATLAALVERMTPHDSLVEPPFAAVFFLTFRQFTEPSELVDALIARYNIVPPAHLSENELFVWQQRKGLPVRLRVSNFIKSWLESYWRPDIDNVVLSPLLSFTRHALYPMFPNPSQRILELIRQWKESSETGVSPKVDRVRDAGFPLNPPSTPSSEIPRPIMHKNLLIALRAKEYENIAITDFDALELARQLTVMECHLYCAIQPEEILETGQSTGIFAVNVKAVSSLSTIITGWVAESILNELDTKKRTALVKFFIKVADRCASIQNFSTPRSILAALDSSTISRLHQTWTGLPQKNKVQLEALRKLADHARNYHEYRSRLRNTAPPAVPFLGLYLTDITFCREGNPSYRASPKNPEKKLLNFNKYHKLARIVQDMQRFQVPYNLKEIHEVQTYLKLQFEQSRQLGDLEDLYRRSLLVEPKQPADTPPTNDVRQLFGWASRSQAQPPTPTSAS